MARFLIRSLVSTIVTMLLVSITLFALLEVGSGDIALKLLGVFSTEAQRASYRKQLGLDRAAWLRYVDWLAGTDWQVSRLLDHPMVVVANPQTGEPEWWLSVNGELTRYKMVSGEMIALVRQPDGSAAQRPVEVNWTTDEFGNQVFWGLDSRNNATKWVRGGGEVLYLRSKTGFSEVPEGPVEYVPLRRGLLRGDPGVSLQFGRPVGTMLLPRIRNTLILAGAAFLVVMPLALFLGALAGINEGKPLDRIISITSLGATATPEFVTGIFLILIFGIWLKILPAVAVFLTPNAIFDNPKLLILPVLTLTAVELGYVARMTRASMVEVMSAPYIRTAIIKGMPKRRVVLNHAVRNALMAPITIIMLHVNWLIGGVVVVEVIFGYPGLGKYIYDAAIFGDYNAVEAAAMVTVLIAVATRLAGDLAYTYLNPRIRFS
ncbi:MAG: ABC transporter permease [Anaerolineales bacterium]|jgi:peptide/nickel transport system permease protein|nr:ABC transporter permease [Anaerolineales bacterium]